MEGNIAWILTSAALVLFMVPGLALFYGGMVRAKNALNMLNMNMWCLGIVPVVWVLVGFSLASGDSGRSWLGDLSVIGMKGINDAEGIATFAFLMTFACITPALSRWLDIQLAGPRLCRRHSNSCQRWSRSISVSHSPRKTVRVASKSTSSTQCPLRDVGGWNSMVRVVRL